MTVLLHTKNALTWVVELESLEPPLDPDSGDLLFGHRAQDVLGGADPALGESFYKWVFINPALGDPLRSALMCAEALQGPLISVFAGIFIEPFDINDPHSRTGILITLIGALVAIMLLSDPFKGILWSQIALSLQLPFTIIPLILLTSSRKVMGDYANRPYGATVLWIVGLIVIGLNIALLVDMSRG